MAEEIAFENGRISNLQGLVTLTLNLDWVICIPSCIIHRPLTTCQFQWNRRNCLWTYVRTYARTDGRTFETHFIRSTQKSRPNNSLNAAYLYRYSRRYKWDFCACTCSGRNRQSVLEI